jgi:hypothetical protein
MKHVFHSYCTFLISLAVFEVIKQKFLCYLEARRVHQNCYVVQIFPNSFHKFHVCLEECHCPFNFLVNIEKSGVYKTG